MKHNHQLLFVWHLVSTLGRLCQRHRCSQMKAPYRIRTDPYCLEGSRAKPLTLMMHIIIFGTSRIWTPHPDIMSVALWPNELRSHKDYTVLRICIERPTRRDPFHWWSWVATVYHHYLTCMWDTGFIILWAAALSDEFKTLMPLSVSGSVSCLRRTACIRRFLNYCTLGTTISRVSLVFQIRRKLETKRYGTTHNSHHLLNS